MLLEHTLMYAEKQTDTFIHAEQPDVLYEAQKQLYETTNKLIETLERQLEALNTGRFDEDEMAATELLNDNLLTTMKAKQDEVQHLHALIFLLTECMCIECSTAAHCRSFKPHSSD